MNKLSCHFILYPGDVQVLKLAELEDSEGRECVIIGTLYKHQKWKPSILQELSEDHQLTLPESKSNYCSEKDQLFLEDEMLRIKLVVDVAELKNYVTGVVCAVLGHTDKDGTFVVGIVLFLFYFSLVVLKFSMFRLFYLEVKERERERLRDHLFSTQIKDWCFSGCIPKNLSVQPRSKGKLVFLSGLDLANSFENLSLSLLTEWICGMAGDTMAQEDVTRVIRVIIAGILVLLHNHTSNVVTNRAFFYVNIVH